MSEIKNTLYIIGAGILWGIISIFISMLNSSGFSAMECVAIRACFTALFLFLYLLVTDKSKFKIRGRDLLYFIGMGIFSIVLFNYCYFKAIDMLGEAAIPALLLYTAPVFVMLLSAVLFREKITVQKVTALLLTFAGLGLVTGAFTGGSAVPAKALLLGLGSGFGYALYSILGKFVVEKYNAVTITFYTFLVAAAGTVPMSGVMTHLGGLLSTKAVIAAIGLALFSTVLPFLFYTKGLAAIEAGKASILATIEPFVAALVGALFFQEHFTPTKVSGMALIVAAIVLLNRKRKQKEQL